jgi:divalent metal cation (Fe/Co/Zn/Cd) transporter
MEGTREKKVFALTSLVAAVLLTKAGFPVGDPLAALGVSVLVMIASVRLAMRSSQVLLDRAPSGVEGQIRKIVASLPHIAEVRKIRVRDAGTQMFVDVTIAVDGDMSLGESHTVTDESERQIAAVISRADVTVHVEPATNALSLNERH